MGSLGLSKGKCGLRLLCTSQKVNEYPWRLAPRTYLWIYPEGEVALIEMIIFACESSRRVISSHEPSPEALEQEGFNKELENNYSMKLD